MAIFSVLLVTTALFILVMLLFQILSLSFSSWSFPVVPVRFASNISVCETSHHFLQQSQFPTPILLHTKLWVISIKVDLVALWNVQIFRSTSLSSLGWFTLDVKAGCQSTIILAPLLISTATYSATPRSQACAGNGAAFSVRPIETGPALIICAATLSSTTPTRIFYVSNSSKRPHYRFSGNAVSSPMMYMDIQNLISCMGVSGQSEMQVVQDLARDMSARRDLVSGS